MAVDFEKYAAKGNEFLHMLAAEMGNYENTEHAGRLLRAVLRAIRSRLTIEQNLRFMAQLPVALKGIYVDGWSSHFHKTVNVKKDFVADVIAEDGLTAWRDFSSISEGKKALLTVLRLLRKNFISPDEFAAIENILPEEIAREAQS